jgi:hypothetical protein
VERRWIDRNFIPGYFDRLYEIERLQYSTDFPLLTKMAYLESQPDDGSYKGIYAEGAIKMLGLLEVWGTFADNQDVSNDGALMIGAGLVKTMGFKAAMEYSKRNIRDDDVDDIFIMDDRSLFMAYLSYQINSFIEVGTIFQREWALDLTSGEYEPVDSYHVGASFTTTF